MFGGALGDLLPLAIGIAISPIPIIACILMLFTAKARVNGPAFLVGWVLGVTVVTTLVVLLSDATAATDVPASGPSLLGIRQWRGRPKPGEEAKMPPWMAAIDQFTPAKAFGFGFLLSAINPKNLGLAAAAGLAIDQGVAAGGSALGMEIVFVVLASLSIAVPVVYVLVGGDGAKRTLEGWRTWLAAHNAAVMAVLFIVIGAKLVGSGLDAILG
jgi:hypothetical protein